MDAPNGSDFAALAARIDELSRVCARLSQENAELRTRVSRITRESSPSADRKERRERREGTPDGKVSRRMMGKALGAAAAGVVGAVALAEASASPAAATTGDSVMAGHLTNAEGATTVQYDGTTAPGVVFLANDTAFTASVATYTAALGGWAGNGHVLNGVYGYSAIPGGSGIVGVIAPNTGSGAGLHGVASDSDTIAVQGLNLKGTAISGVSTSSDHDATAIIGILDTTLAGDFSAAVKGQNNGTGTGRMIGVFGSQAGSGWGVYGATKSGIGVNAEGGSGTGVQAFGGTVGVAASGPIAVQANGSNIGVRAGGTNFGVRATAPVAVRAIGSGTAGVGINGSGSGNGGRGGAFSGAAAQVQLIPGPLPTHPRSGRRGDLYVDSHTRLWFCRTAGNTAVWHQVA